MQPRTHASCSPSGLSDSFRVLGQTCQAVDGVRGHADHDLEDLEHRLGTLSENINLCNQVLNDLRDLSGVLESSATSSRASMLATVSGLCRERKSETSMLAKPSDEGGFVTVLLATAERV
ncbi:hypothetical protein EYF80_000424 [Liparis tanakae]|uniref:Uncharacterized protein n=1 Tax=Liparis tanakae TaxID=230148 RepID=A0A4Z2JFV2_9TELE|nr:hypothetical protein EYF80_000424 [Liparis tanakae]